MITTEQLKGNWMQLRGKVKSQWGKLTDDDLDVIDGDREQLEGRLVARYGKAKEQIENEVDEFCKQCDC